MTGTAESSSIAATPVPPTSARAEFAYTVPALAKSRNWESPTRSQADVGSHASPRDFGRFDFIQKRFQFGISYAFAELRIVAHKLQIYEVSR